MDCLRDNYESSLDCSSSELMEQTPPPEQTHRDQATQTTKKTKQLVEIERLQAELAEKTEG